MCLDNLREIVALLPSSGEDATSELGFGPERKMALQAPERRERTLEEDLERAFALSQADKRLGEYFPPIENPTHGWHYDGTEHTGGGFDSDMYAFRSRGQIKKEFEVSVVQWARERNVAEQAWATEEAARNVVRRNEDRKMKSIWAPEEADIIEARREAEKAWAQEQMELEGLAPSSKDRTAKPRRSEVPTMVDARRLNETLYRPNIGELNPKDRTGAWLTGRSEQAGIREGRMDPTEQNELHTMDVYEEELRRRRRAHEDIKARSSSGRGSPVRRPSMVSSSKPPSLPSKSIPGDEVGMSPGSASQRSFDEMISQGERLESPPASEHTATSRRRSMKSVASAPATSVPPSLPSKDSGRGSPDSMATESRRSARSVVESVPEPIDILSPETEGQPSTRVHSRPVSSASRRIESFVMDNKEPIIQERPLSYAAMMTGSWVDLKNREPVSMKSREPEDHVRSSATSWRNFPPPETLGNDMLFDETIISGLPATSEPSMSTLVAADRLVSPASQIAQQFRQMALDAAADPTNSIYLRDMPFTVPGMFSRSALSVTEEMTEEPEEEYGHQRNEEPEPLEEEALTPRQRPTSMAQRPTSIPPRPTSIPQRPPSTTKRPHSTTQRPTSIPHPLRLPNPSINSSNPPPNIDKSLPGTPYTMTHSVVSAPEFDADALEAEQQTEESYYRQYPNSLPPGYSSGSKTSKGSMLKSQRDSFATMKEYGKSNTSLVSAQSAKTSSTGAMGDVEAQEVLNPVRNAERRPSKRSSQRRHKPEGSVTSDGSGSTIKASNHARSQSSASDDARRLRAHHETPRERGSTSRVHSRHQRSKSDLPPGTSHTRISHSDSESAQEVGAAQIPDEAQGSSAHSSPISVDLSDDDGQFAMVPEVEETHAPGRMSGQTFGMPTGTSMTFRDSRDWRASHEPRNDSKVSLPSRPISMAPSTRSNRTRASTLRASMKSPLANISERDTASEVSFRGDEINESGSFGVAQNGNGTSGSNEIIQEEPEEQEETPMDKYGMGPAWRAELWGSVAWDAAAARRSSSTKRKLAVDKQGNLIAAGHKKSGEDIKSSSSSLGDELKDNFTLGHPPDSYHGSQRNSTANAQSSGMEEHTSSGNKGQDSSSHSKLKHNVGEVVEWHEDSEVGMAGIGAHGIRAKVSYKEPTPEESDGFED